MDTLVEALLPALHRSGEGRGFGPGGEVSTGDVFRQLNVAWSFGEGLRRGRGHRG